MSTVPGCARAISCHSSECCDMPEASICETRLYSLPTRPSIFSHFGLFGSPGGFVGLYEMWQAPHAMPMRNGGSTEPSNSFVARESSLPGRVDQALR